MQYILNGQTEGRHRKDVEVLGIFMSGMVPDEVVSDALATLGDFIRPSEVEGFYARGRGCRVCGGRNEAVNDLERVTEAWEVLSGRLSVRLRRHFALKFLCLDRYFYVIPLSFSFTQQFCYVLFPLRSQPSRPIFIKFFQIPWSGWDLRVHAPRRDTPHLIADLGAFY